MLRRLLTVSQVCEIDGVGKTTVYERIQRGEYDAIRDGTDRIKITEESIERRRALFGVPVERKSLRTAEAASAA